MAGITGTTKQEEDLRSRMPDPLRFVPEMAGAAEGLHKAIRNGAIPQHQPAAEDVTLTRGEPTTDRTVQQEANRRPGDYAQA
ncbi:hypothetical protein ABZ297_26535 [Nonomuraea sp. NPDC005983]|uniref:hypothetical protein n=1 Tax=Nonomuraea sp. NPDC005983 TaxID=3155595 RepID=UPI0033A9CA2A